MDRIKNHPILGETPKKKKLHSVMMGNCWKAMKANQLQQH